MYYTVMLLDIMMIIIVGLASYSMAAYLIEAIKYVDGIYFDTQYHYDDDLTKLASIFVSVSTMFLYMYSFSPISSSI